MVTKKNSHSGDSLVLGKIIVFINIALIKTAPPANVKCANKNIKNIFHSKKGLKEHSFGRGKI